MSGIEQAIEKMVQDATADLRQRIEALEALADAVRIAVHVGRATAVADVPPPAAKLARTANGNGATRWTAALRREAARRMKKRNSDPAFLKARAKGNARRWREWRAQQSGSSS